MEISILRLGHRLPRDERITTHVALVSRAFGATEFIYCGQHDSSLEKSVSSIVDNWGGSLSVRHEKSYSKVINEHKKNGFVVCHLTMYGLPVLKVLGSESCVSRLKTRDSKLLVIVGAEQVPSDVYQLSDFNAAVTNQPHSEVAALGIFLNEVTQHRMLEEKDFANAKIKIVPTEKGKNIEKL
ncbi:MAG: tRNA (cytidine(56)-2'-O)-methyltransferase [Candidatus Micrarchaeota archaeon]|nr:tRNA (cytidine(56)-2'-O)-methyltransferase [Candidatus Micrarchaeota archaeon]